MSNGNKFLTIPSQESFFTTIENVKSPEGDSSSPVEDEDDEEADETSRLIPRSSPVPRKRGLSIFDETAEYMKTRLALPSRRVSFADTSGRELVKVKEFVAFDSDEEDVGKNEANSHTPHNHNSEPIYLVCPEFQESSEPGLLLAVRTNKVEVESVSLIEDEPLTFEGLIRVLNICFHKAVYVRFTMDGWSTFFDYPAEYVHGSNDMETDRFSFKLSFAQPYLYPGSRIEFVVRFETPEGNYWANNGGKNYSVVLNLKQKQKTDEPKETGGETVKSILKASRCRTETDYEEDLTVEEEAEDIRKSKTEMNVSRQLAPPPQIFQPEIDIENIIVSSSPTESCSSPQTEGIPPSAKSLKEQPLQFSVEVDDLTASTTNQPLITQDQVEFPQPPSDMKENCAFMNDCNDATISVHVAASTENIRELSPSGHVDEREALCVIQPVLSSSSQATESDSQSTAVDNMPLQQDDIQIKSEPPLSGVMLHSYKLNEMLNTDWMARARNAPTDEQKVFSHMTLEPPDVADSSAGSRQHPGNYQDTDPGDAVDRSHSGSLDKTQTLLLPPDDEPEKITDAMEVFTTGKQAITAETLRMGREGNQASIDKQSDLMTSLTAHVMPTASIGSTQSKDSFVTRQIFAPVLHSMPFQMKQDPVSNVDSFSFVSTGDLDSVQPLAETLDVTSYQFIEEERCFTCIRNETSRSPDTANDVLPSATASLGATMSENRNYLTVMDENISVDDDGEMFAHNLEKEATTPQNTDDTRMEDLSQTQQTVLDSLVSELTISEASQNHRFLITAFVALQFIVCLAMIIINSNIILIIGLYLILHLF